MWCSLVNFLYNGRVRCPNPVVRSLHYESSQYGPNKKMVRLPSIQIAFEYRTICHPNSFWPFKYQTSLVFRPALLIFIKESYQISFSVGDKTPVLCGSWAVVGNGCHVQLGQRVLHVEVVYIVVGHSRTHFLIMRQGKLGAFMLPVSYSS